MRLLSCLLLAVAPTYAAAQTATRTVAPVSTSFPLQLKWELKEDAFENGRGFSRAAFTLTNRDSKPLPGSGWAIYYNALHEPQRDSVSSGFRIEEVTGGLLRLVPGPGFEGLAPGHSKIVEYRTGLMTNRSFAPTGPYIVFDDAKDTGRLLAEYIAVPFERFPQGPGRDPRVVTPEAQFALDSVIRDIPLAELPLVFPTPVLAARGEGELRLATMPAIGAAAELKSEAAFAAEYLTPYFGKARAATAGPGLTLTTGAVEGQSSPEAYELVVDAKGIRIVGASPAGVFYGLQSLRGLLPAPTPAKGLVLPAVTVRDAPRFPYRGFMLDVARNFHTKASLLRVIDLIARYKLNALHLHMTEDEAWRVEIPSLPELTSVGSRRGHTLDSGRWLPPIYGSGPIVDRPWGSGHYSRADYAEILRYAAARHIEVVPEIEMPGHARAAIKAMEARARVRGQAREADAKRYLLSDPDDRSEYTSAQNYHDNVMNPALESTYAFIEKVVADLVTMHREAGVPLRNLHMGGDEVPGGVWERSPAVQAYLKQHGLASVDDMWFVFYGRVEQILKAHGMPLSGWEEIAVRKTRRDGQALLIPNPAFAERGWRAYVWNNVPGWGAEDLAYRLANGGFKVVLCPVTNIYFDLAWNPNPEEPGLDWGGYVDLRKPFQFVPFDYYRNVRLDRRGQRLDPAVFVGKDRLTDYGKANIIGIQGNLWSETLGGDGRLDYMLVPKLFGLVERAWAADPDWAVEPDPQKSEPLYREAWSRFVNVLGKRELPRLDRELPGFKYRVPTPGLRSEAGQVQCSVELPGFTVRYTTDGSEPTPRSPECRGGVPHAGGFRAAAFDTTGRKGHTVRLAVP